MAKYRVLARAYIKQSLREPGDIVDFDFVGPCPEHLELVVEPKAPVILPAPTNSDLV